MYRLGWTSARGKAYTHVLHRARVAPVRRRVHALPVEAARGWVGRLFLDAPARAAVHGARALGEGRLRQGDARGGRAATQAVLDHPEGHAGTRRVAHRSHERARRAARAGAAEAVLRRRPGPARG